MRTMQLLTSAGLFLAAGSAHGRPGVPIGQDDTTCSNGVRAYEHEGQPALEREPSEPQRQTRCFPVMWRAGAASPSPTELVVTRPAERMRQSNLDIPDKGITEEPRRQSTFP
jgi:hypothetical protein